MNMSRFAIPQKCEIPEGAYGVWQIPELNVVIPVYESNKLTAQKNVDKENSAAIYKFGVGRVIADHADSKSNNGRGIWELQKVHPDDLAFMVTKSGTIAYKCIQVCRVKVHPGGYTLDGTGIYPRLYTDIFCAGCANASGTENYLAVFKQTGKLP